MLCYIICIPYSQVYILGIPKHFHNKHLLLLLAGCWYSWGDEDAANSCLETCKKTSNDTSCMCLPSTRVEMRRKRSKYNVSWCLFSPWWHISTQGMEKVCILVMLHFHQSRAKSLCFDHPNLPAQLQSDSKKKLPCRVQLSCNKRPFSVQRCPKGVLFGSTKELENYL